MAVTVVPRFDLSFSVSIDHAEWDDRYIAYGSEDEEEVKDAVIAAVPETRGALFLQDIGFAHIGGGVWEIHASYATVDRSQQEPQPPDEAAAGTYSFDTGGQTQHIQSALATTRYPGSAPLSHLLIGAAKDRVEGVDIIVPVFHWMEARVLPAEMVTQAYKLTLMDLTGKVNNAAFRGTAAGETLFKGASGKQDKIDRVEITYSFAASPNRTGITVGEGASAITGIAKKGWELLDIRYADATDSNRLVKKPVAIYVHQVYETRNFALLGIGA